MVRLKEWMPEELALLRELAGTVKTADIARALCERFGTTRTRNSVIGMAHRLHIDIMHKLPVTKRPRLPKPPRKLRPKARPKPPFNMNSLPPDGCRWIDDDPRAARPFTCGEKAQPNYPYCVTHARRAGGIK